MTSAVDPSARMQRRSRLPIFIVVVCAVAYLVAMGARRSAAPQAEGTAVNGRVTRAASTRPTLRVGTFNIQSGHGLDHRLDLDRTAGCLKDCDLIGLNEVSGAQFNEPKNQAEILGDKLGLAWLYAPSEIRWWHEHWGNGLLTSLPVREWVRIPLRKTTPNGFRSVLLSRQEFNGRVINILITHLDGTEDRQSQLRAVITLFQSLAPPAILMGDLNTQPDDPQLKALVQLPGISDPLSQLQSKWAAKHIDWILTSGCKIAATGVIDPGASDHAFYWVDLEFK